jgi:hypothetical protein
MNARLARVSRARRSIAARQIPDGAICVRCAIAQATSLIPAPVGHRIAVCETCRVYYELGGRDAKEVMGLHPNGERISEEQSRA